jgi:hypothetical protein
MVSLPPLPEILPPSVRTALQSLEQLGDDELQRYARAIFPQDPYERYVALREEQRERKLAPAEQNEFEQLSHCADLLVLQKAYAAVILKRRGQSDVIALDEGL